MDERKALVQLRDILEDLYRDPASIRRVVHDVGLEEAQIAFSDRARDSWDSVLEEAQKHGRVEYLISSVALVDYPESAVLRDALGVYLAAKKNKSLREPLRQSSWYITYGVVVFGIAAIILFARSVLNNHSATPVEPAAAITPTDSQTPPASVIASDVVTKTNPQDNAVYSWIPAGTFMMGSSTTDTLAMANEKPQHEVFLDGFWIMQTEVTNAQYERCVKATGCVPPSNTRWNDPTYASHPVVNVTWKQVESYTKWMGGRLPTEAEWEKACRGTAGWIYPWGNDAPNDNDKLLNYERIKNDTMPVGSYPPEINGLSDMAGNVEEWTNDWFSENYYKNSTPRNPKGPADTATHTKRGGSFGNVIDNVRCAARSKEDPDYGNDVIGFRVASDGF